MIMKNKYKITIAIWLFVILVSAFITSASRSPAAVAAFMLLVLLLLAIDVGGSVYKLIRWSHYHQHLRQHGLLALARGRGFGKEGLNGNANV